MEGKNRGSLAGNPDLDWSQVRETVMMFRIAVALIEHSMSDGDHSIREMIDQFSTMAGKVAQIRFQVQQMHEESKEFFDSLGIEEEGRVSIEAYLSRLKGVRGGVERNCATMNHTLDDAIVAFQDFDRLSQQLEHIGRSLNATADLVEDSSRIYDPYEWLYLQEKIRSTFAMVDSQVLFEAMLKGESKEEALRQASVVKRQSGDQFEAF